MQRSLDTLSRPLESLVVPDRETDLPHIFQRPRTTQLNTLRGRSRDQEILGSLDDEVLELQVQMAKERLQKLRKIAQEQKHAEGSREIK